MSRFTVKPQSHLLGGEGFCFPFSFFPLPQMVYVALALHFQASVTWMMDEDLLWTSEARLECRCQTQDGLPSSLATGPNWAIPSSFMKYGNHELFQSWKEQALHSWKQPSWSRSGGPIPQYAGDIDPAHHAHCKVRHERLDGRGSTNRSNHYLKHSSSQAM